MDNSAVSKNIVCQQNFEVRWGDCDAAGIVYYAKFFDWFTDGKLALVRQINLPYLTFFHEQGITMVAIEAQCRYYKTLKLEEKFIIRTTLSELSRTRMTFTYVITKFNDGMLVAEGKTVHVYVDETGKPFDVKKRYPELWDRLSKYATN